MNDLPPNFAPADLAGRFAEDEYTFAFDGKELPTLLERLWPETCSVEIDGEAHILIVQKVETSIHVYSAESSDSERRRLKLRFRRRGLVGRVQHKQVQGDRKWCQVEADDVKGRSLVAALRQFGPVSAALAKERCTTTYAFRGRGSSKSFKVGIDRISPFDPADPAIRGPLVHHVEFEGPGLDQPGGVCRSSFFREQLAPLLRPLDASDAKWRMIHGSGVTLPEFEDSAELERYCRKAVRELAAPGALLHPLELPVPGSSEGG